MYMHEWAKSELLLRDFGTGFEGETEDRYVHNGKH